MLWLLVKIHAHIKLLLLFCSGASLWVGGRVADAPRTVRYVLAANIACERPAALVSCCDPPGPRVEGRQSCARSFLVAGLIQTGGLSSCHVPYTTICLLVLRPVFRAPRHPAGAGTQ